MEINFDHRAQNSLRLMVSIIRSFLAVVRKT